MSISDLSNYYLDIEKISTMKTASERSKVHEYYADMLAHYSNAVNGIGSKAVAESYFNTLTVGGFLRNIRDKKLEKILDEDNSVNN